MNGCGNCQLYQVEITVPGKPCDIVTVYADSPKQARELGFVKWKVDKAFLRS